MSDSVGRSKLEQSDAFAFLLLLFWLFDNVREQQLQPSATGQRNLHTIYEYILR